MTYIDDILVTGAMEEEHFKTLEEVLRRLAEYGIRMKKSKYYFMQDRTGWCIWDMLWTPREYMPRLRRYIDAIEKAPRPQNVSQLRSFLGLLNYYRKFVPNSASIIQPLNQLLQKGKRWVL
jgi:hypothetical protein